jgi:hypothetical protein
MNTPNPSRARTPTDVDAIGLLTAALPDRWVTETVGKLAVEAGAAPIGDQATSGEWT